MRTIVAASITGLAGLIAGAALVRAPAVVAQEQAVPAFLHIDECELPAGTIVADAIRQAGSTDNDVGLTARSAAEEPVVLGYGCGSSSPPALVPR